MISEKQYKRFNCTRNFTRDEVKNTFNHCGKHDFNSEKTLWKWWEWFQDRRLIRFKDAFFNKLHLDQNKILEVKLEHDGIN